MVSFPPCTGGPSQYNKTRKRNQVYELERKRSMLNALPTINLTLQLEGEGHGALFLKLEWLYTASQFSIFVLDVYYYLLNTSRSNTRNWLGVVIIFLLCLTIKVKNVVIHLKACCLPLIVSLSDGAWWQRPRVQVSILYSMGKLFSLSETYFLHLWNKRWNVFCCPVILLR